LSEYYFGLIAGALVGSAIGHAEELARTAAARALQLDPSSREAHAVLCGMAALIDHDWAEAERRYRLATEGAGVPAEARRMCGFNYLLAAGRPGEAARELEMALQDDPLNSFIALQRGACVHAAGDAERALTCFRQALELDENNWIAHANVAFCLLERGELRDAAAEFERAHAIAPGSEMVMCGSAAVLTLRGDDAGALGWLTRARAGAPHRVPAALFTYYNLIHDLAKAADCGAEALARRDGTVTFLSQFAFCRDLRRSAYWPSLAMMMKLPVSRA
jgi:tetratricopeptide (TPR) repeat protein